jgi:RNA polymerase sigma-70 factor (ECF subfamily)
MALDQETVVQILLRERLRLAGSVMVILRDAHLADDIFQQVVLQALPITEQFREAEHVRAWALRTARHRALDLCRGRKLQCVDAGVLDLLEQDWSGTSSDDMAERVEALHHCLDKLPEGSRKLLRLRYEEGLRCATVAERLRRSVDAIYQSLSRVHRQLRECVQGKLQAAGGGTLGEVVP